MVRTLWLAALLLICCLVSFAGAQRQNDPGEPGVITGKVLNASGQPLRDARVYVREHNMPQIGALRYVTTSEDGEFRFVGLRPGDYDVFAVPSESASMLTRWSERVHLPKDKPFGRVTVRVGITNNNS